MTATEAWTDPFLSYSCVECRESHNLYYNPQGRAVSGLGYEVWAEECVGRFATEAEARAELDRLDPK